MMEEGSFIDWQWVGLLSQVGSAKPFTLDHIQMY